MTVRTSQLMIAFLASLCFLSDAMPKLNTEKEAPPSSPSTSSIHLADHHHAAAEQKEVLGTSTSTLAVQNKDPLAPPTAEEAEQMLASALMEETAASSNHEETGAPEHQDQNRLPEALTTQRGRPQQDQGEGQGLPSVASHHQQAFILNGRSRITYAGAENVGNRTCSLSSKAARS